jgi:dihydropteroate synthase
MIWRARQFEFRFPRPALIMGILNVTPDSFSDGGRHFDAAQAHDFAERMILEGADLIDVGGESTRPAAAPVSEAEELRRVIPILERLAGRAIPISIDTMKPVVARAALAAGASVVNDVAANRDDPAMWRIVAEAGAGYVAMHMQGTPPTMQEHPVYENVTAEVDTFFGDRLDRCVAAGMAAEQVVFDPGLGFGKTTAHNLELLANLERFHRWNRPLLVGASRKSFIGQVVGGAPVSEREAGSLACACWAVQAGAGIVRTHDVAATRQALRVTEALRARHIRA